MRRNYSNSGKDLMTLSGNLIIETSVIIVFGIIMGILRKD